MEMQHPAEILNRKSATISINETALVLGISAQALRAHIKKTGQICDQVPVLMVGRSLRVPLTALQKKMGLCPLTKQDKQLVVLANYLSVIASDMSKAKEK